MYMYINSFCNTHCQLVRLDSTHRWPASDLSTENVSRTLVFEELVRTKRQPTAALLGLRLQFSDSVDPAASTLASTISGISKKKQTATYFVQSCIYNHPHCSGGAHVRMSYCIHVQCTFTVHIYVQFMYNVHACNNVGQ